MKPANGLEARAICAETSRATFSVIVPCYNYGRYLRDAVASVLKQSFANTRLLIIDDASSDNSAEVAAALVAEDNRVEFVRHKFNKGHIATYNRGLEWANGDYFLLLSADDFLLPGAFDRAASLFTACPDVVLSYGRCRDVNDIAMPPTTQSAVPRQFKWTIIPGPTFIELSGHRNLVPTPTAIVRTEVQKRVGSYRPDLPHCGDMEMWWRFACHGDIGFIHDQQAAKRQHSDNMAHQYFATWLPDLEQRGRVIDVFYATYAARSPNAERIKRQAKRSLARMATHCARSALLQARLPQSDEIADFARSLWPEIVETTEWRRLMQLQSLHPSVLKTVARTIASLKRRLPRATRAASAMRFRAFD